MFLSVITINRNNAKGLEKTLNSVRIQSCDDYEHVIIDGASTDDSVDVIKNYLSDEKYAKHVTYWCSESDGGIFPAMNKSLSHISGKYCIFLNSGDWFYDENSVKKIIDAKPVEDIIYFNSMMITSVESYLKVYPSIIDSLYFYKGSTLSHQNTIIRSDFQKRYPFDCSYPIGADANFFINAFIKCNCTYRHVNDVITYFDAETGISNNPKTEEARKQEWNRMWDTYYPPIIRKDLEELFQYRYYYKGMLGRMKRLFDRLKGIKS